MNRRNEKYYLQISNKNISKMLKLASQTQNEVCGVLIGKKIKKKRFFISEIIYDDSSLDATPYSVTRNTRSLYPHVKDIVEKYIDDKVDFIGDWHSHPNGLTNVSGTDKNTIIDMLTDPDYFFLDSIILIIVSPPIDIKSYLFMRGVNESQVMTINIKK